MLGFSNHKILARLIWTYSKLRIFRLKAQFGCRNRSPTTFFLLWVFFIATFNLLRISTVVSLCFFSWRAFDYDILLSPLCLICRFFSAFFKYFLVIHRFLFNYRFFCWNSNWSCYPVGKHKWGYFSLNFSINSSFCINFNRFFFFTLLQILYVIFLILLWLELWNCSNFLHAMSSKLIINHFPNFFFCRFLLSFATKINRFRFFDINVFFLFDFPLIVLGYFLAKGPLVFNSSICFSFIILSDIQWKSLGIRILIFFNVMEFIKFFFDFLF